MTGQICLNTVYSSTFKLPSNNSSRPRIKASLTLQYKQAKRHNAAQNEAFVTQAQVVELCVCVCVCVEESFWKIMTLYVCWRGGGAVIHTGYSLIQTTGGSGVQGRDRLHEQGSCARGCMSERRLTHTYSNTQPPDRHTHLCTWVLKLKVQMCQGA